MDHRSATKDEGVGEDQGSVRSDDVCKQDSLRMSMAQLGYGVVRAAKKAGRSQGDIQGAAVKD